MLPLNSTTRSAGMYDRFGMGQTPSPFYNLSNEFAPRNFHDVIKWVRYITVQSPTTTEVLRKYATYPITDFVIDTKDKKLKETYEQVIKSFRLKAALKDIGFDYYSLGNVFVSVYFPTRRWLTCPTCKQEFNARTTNFYEFKNFEFRGTCPKCNSQVTFQHREETYKDIDQMNLVKWTADNISVNHNPITGESEYYYQIPNSVKKKVRTGDKLFISTIPWSFIEAIKNNQDFKLDNNNLYHLKTISMGSQLEGMGMPPLVSLYSLVFHQAVLRRANEAIASEYLTPLRAVFPQAGNGSSDPVSQMSLQGFSQHMEQQFRRHKRDQNHIMVSPIPIGYQNLGGEGKTLMVSQEMQQTDENILLALGVSKELLSGTTNWTSSTVGLRLLENSMQDYVSQMEEFMDWLFDIVSSFLGIQKVDVTMTPFQLTDDETTKEALLQLLQDGKASLTTVYEAFGMDYQKELERIRKDLVAEQRNNVKSEYDAAVASFMENKETNRSETEDGGYKETLEEANRAVSEIMQTSPDKKVQKMLDLHNNDPVLYSIVYSLLEKFNKELTMVSPDPEEMSNNPNKPPQQKQQQQTSQPQQSNQPQGGE